MGKYKTFRELKKKLEKQKAIAYRQTELREHYEDLFTTWVWELKFAWEQIDFYLNLLDEINELTDDLLVIQVIQNWLQRATINKMKHTRELFGKNPKWFNTNKK